MTSLISVHSPIAKGNNPHSLQVCRHTVVAVKLTVAISSSSSGHVTGITSAAIFSCFVVFNGLPVLANARTTRAAAYFYVSLCENTAV